MGAGAGDAQATARQQVETHECCQSHLQRTEGARSFASLEESALKKNREDEQQSECAGCKCCMQAQRDVFTISKSLQPNHLKTLTSVQLGQACC